MLRLYISLIFAAALFHSCTGKLPECPSLCFTTEKVAEASARKLCGQPLLGLCEVLECTGRGGKTGFGCRLPAGCIVIPESKVNGLEFFVNYSWTAPSGDLDTGTEFLGTTVGAVCGTPNNDILMFSGDSFFTGNLFETTTVQIGLAREQGLWTDQAEVNMNGDWFGTAFNPVILSAEFRDAATGAVVKSETFEVDAATNLPSCSTLLATASVKILGKSARLCIGIA